MLKRIHNFYKLITSVRNFHQVLFLYLGGRSNSKFLKLTLWNRHSLYIRTNTTDFHEVISVVSGTEYPMHFLTKPSLPEDLVVVDIGAHIGTFTLSMLAQYPNAFVHAIEANKENSALLKKNIAVNGYTDRVLISSYAISNQDGLCTLFFSPDAPNQSSIHLHGAKKVIAKKIQAKTLATYCKEKKLKRIDILKLDCEGCEYDCITNFPKNVNHVLIEYHTGIAHKKPSTLKTFFIKEGYMLKYHRKNPELNSGIYIFSKEL